MLKKLFKRKREQNFASRLKTLRKSTKLSLIELSIILRVSKDTLESYEKNKSEPDIFFANRCSDFFGVHLDYMLGLTDVKYDIDMHIQYILRATYNKVHNMKEYKGNNKNIESNTIEDILKLLKEAIKISQINK